MSYAHVADNMLGPKGMNLGRMKSPYYDTIIDLLFESPSISMGEIAKKLKKTNSWVSSIVHSDSFKQVYAERRAARLSLSNERIVDALHGVTLRSLDITAKRLETNPEGVSTRLAMEIAEKSLDALGYTSKLTGPALAIANSQTNVTNVFGVDAESFARAQQFIRDREQGQLVDSRSLSGGAIESAKQGSDVGNPSSLAAPAPDQVAAAGPKSVEDLFEELFPSWSKDSDSVEDVPPPNPPSTE
jgi:hypothetical protein